MNLLIVSNYLEFKSQKCNDNHIDFAKWNKGKLKHNYCDYNVICMDLTFLDDCTDYSTIKAAYLDVYDYIVRDSFKGGLILIVICGSDDKILFFHEDKENGDVLTFSVYDHLRKIVADLMKVVKIRSGGKPDKSIREYEEYFKYVLKYNVYTENAEDIEIIKKVICKTNGSISASPAFEVSIENGHLIVLPGYDINNTSKVSTSLIRLANKLFESKLEKTGNSDDRMPAWVRQYMPAFQKSIPAKIRSLEKQKSELDEYCFLMYGNGKVLEEIIKKVLEEFGLKVEKTHSSESYDLYVTDKQNRELFIEVTGSQNKFDTDNAGRKNIQILDFKFKNPGKNAMLMVNPMRLEDIQLRQQGTMITEKVLKPMLATNVTIITTYDLYFIWEAYRKHKFNKKTVTELLFNANGYLSFNKESLQFESKGERNGSLFFSRC